MAKNTAFVKAKTLMIAMIEASNTPLELAAGLYEGYGLDPFGSSLMDALSVKPVLGIVETKTDGRRYFKQFNPFTGLESHGEFIGEREIESRLSQFTDVEQRQIEHSLRHIDSREHHRGWQYVRLAQLGDLST